MRGTSRIVEKANLFNLSGRLNLPGRAIMVTRWTPKTVWFFLTIVVLFATGCTGDERGRSKEDAPLGSSAKQASPLQESLKPGASKNGMQVPAASTMDTEHSGTALDPNVVVIDDDSAPAEALAPAADPPAMGDDAFKQATRSGMYVFAVCVKERNPQAAALQQVVERAAARSEGKARALVIDVRATASVGVVRRLGLSRLPMPFAMVLAPNGAVTGGFPLKCTEAQLLNALATPGQANCYRALQGGKLVLLCFLGRRSESNASALKGVTDFANAQTGTHVIRVNASDSGEARLRQQFGVKADLEQAVTVVVAPPANVLGRISGRTTKEGLAALINQACSSCGPAG